MFTTVQEGIQAIQKKNLSDTPPEHALYIPAQGKRTTYATEDAFDLYPVVNEFLKFESVDRHSRESGNLVGDVKDSKDQKQLMPTIDSRRKVLLLLGDTGSGKSLFCQDLITRLWQNYKPGSPIPLFTSLARLQDPIDNAIEETLAAYGFSAEQIAILKKEQQFIFVLDGYDEIHQFKNLYVTNKLNEWNARTIITCRSQYLYYLSDTDKHFMPFHSEKRQPQLLQQFYVAPFSEKEIVAYVQQYEKLNGQAIVADLKDHKSDTKSTETPKSVLYQQLVSIPGLQSLITTPFLLHLAVEALPDILEKHKDSKDQKNTELQKLTQAALYDVFIERWFKRQELKLKTSKHIDEKSADPKPNFWKFCKELAVTMRAQNVTLVNYTPEKISKFASATVQAKLNPWKQFFSEEKDVELLRSACPIRKLGHNQYGFIHASLIEYFATRAMYEEVVAQQPQQITISAVSAGDSKNEKLSIEITDQKSSPVQPTDLSPLPQSTLYQSSITKQNNMIQFLADRVQESEVFKKKLFEAIESSRKDERYAVGAANAITALNCAEVNFNGMDFKGIRIPGANLGGALCDSTNFENADLSDVNFQSAWLRAAQLKWANLKGLRFGELPFIQLQSSALACSYSPDGRWLAVAISVLDEIQLFNASNQAFVRIFTGHAGGMNSIAWDAKSERLASGSGDNVQVWGVATGKELCTLAGHTSSVNSVAWDAKGEWLASGSSDMSVRVWEVSSSKVLHVLRAHTSWVHSVAWDAKSKRLASGSGGNSRGKDNKDYTVRVWDAASGKELHVLRGHTNTVTSVAWDTKSERLASGSDDNTVRVWDAASGKVLHVLQGHTDRVKNISWNAKNDRLASGGWDNTVRVWETVTGKGLRMLQGHTSWVNSVAWTADGERLASGGPDKTVRMWEMTGKELRVLKGYMCNMRSVAWDAKGERLASGSGENWNVFDNGNKDYTVRVWEAVSGKELRTLVGHVNRVKSIAWDAKSERLATGSMDKTVRVWDASSGKELRILAGHASAVNCIAWDAKGECLVSGSEDFTVRVWEIASGKELWVLKGHTNAVNCVAWDAKSERLASGSYDHTVRLWDVVSGKELRIMEGHRGSVNSVAWDAKGECLASGGGGGTLEWSYKATNSVRVWDVVSGKVLHILEGHTGLVNSVVWDAKSERLASAANGDRTVRVWEVASSKELLRMQLPHEVRSCAWIIHHGEERLVVVLGQGAACFSILKVKDSLQARLNWLATSDNALYIDQLDITDVMGLDSNNYLFLQQRGAIGKPALIVDEKDVASSPSLAQLAIQHSSIFSAPVSDAKSSNTVTPADVKLDMPQQSAASIDITSSDKSKNDSSCVPCCSRM